MYGLILIRFFRSIIDLSVSIRKLCFNINKIHSIVDICELGRSSKAFSELSGRTDPLVSDVAIALVEMGK